MIKKITPVLLALSIATTFSACTSYSPTKTSLLYGYYLIKGESMMPTLEAPTVVLVKPTPYETIKKGDIIVFQQRDKLVAHRAIKKVNHTWVTRGDGAERQDPFKVSMYNYKGSVYTESTFESAVHKNILGELHAANTAK